MAEAAQRFLQASCPNAERLVIPMHEGRVAQALYPIALFWALVPPLCAGFSLSERGNLGVVVFVGHSIMASYYVHRLYEFTPASVLTLSSQIRLSRQSQKTFPSLNDRRRRVVERGQV